MAQETPHLPLSPDGFIEKNLPRLKHFAHIAYMFSRVPAFWMAVVNMVYYFLDFAYFHTPGGIPVTYLWVSAILFVDNGLLKFAQRFMELHDLTVYASAIKVKYDPEEPWWHRLVFRLVIFRRGMIKRLVIVVECVTVVLCALALNARMLNENLYAWGSQFPYVLKPISAHSWTLSDNIWIWLMIVVAAGVLALINNAVFVIKSPGVQRTLLATLKELPHTDHPAMLLAVKFFELLRGNGNGNGNGNGGNGGTPCDQNAMAKKLAEIILLSYPEAMLSEEQKVIFQRELAEMLCRGTDVGALREYLMKKIPELRGANEKK